MITKISIKKLDNIEIINNELLNSNIKNKSSRSDIVIEYKDGLILIEINKHNYKELINRNYVYLHKVGMNLYLKNEKKYKDKRLVIINIDNFDYFGKGKLIYESQMREKTFLQIENRNLISYHINLKYFDKKCYTKDEPEKIK